MKLKIKCFGEEIFSSLNHVPSVSVFAVGWQDLIDEMVDETKYVLTNKDQKYLKECQKRAFRSVLIEPTSTVFELHEKTVKIVRDYRAFGSYTCTAEIETTSENSSSENDEMEECGASWSSAHARIGETQSCKIHRYHGVLAHERRTKGGGGGFYQKDKNHLGDHCSACVRGDKCV